MRMSGPGLAVLADLEGEVLFPYQDVAGYWTIGVGHKLTKKELASGKIIINGNAYPWEDGITMQLSRALLRQNVKVAEDAVDKLVHVPLKQCQFDALVSFAYNVGTWAFRTSTLRRRLNKGDYECVPWQLARWIYSRGKPYKGLVHRREVEAGMWRGEYPV